MRWCCGQAAGARAAGGAVCRPRWRGAPVPGAGPARAAPGWLDAEAAGQLLAAQVGTLAPQVRDRLIGETGGNPLALLELPAGLSSQQLAGLERLPQRLPQRLPLTAGLRRVFLERVQRLPDATQTLLLVAAAEDTGELATILAAASVLGVDKEALAQAEQAGLVQVTGFQLVFRHPLVRSAIYQDASLFGRRAAHRALVEVLQGGQQADRRAWYLAAAALSPDEQVASELEASADRARRRGGPAAAALERAAALTPQAGLRARRLVAAADPRRATEMLVLAARAALSANQPNRIVAEISPAVSGLSGQCDVRVKRVADSLIALGLGHGELPAATVDLPSRVATSWPHPAFIWMWPMLVVAEPTGADATADQRYARAVAARRAAGTVSALTVAWPTSRGDAGAGRREAGGGTGAAAGAPHPQHPTAHAPIALLATGTLVEAAARAGRLEGMEPHVAKFERWAQWDPRTWTQVIARRCRALVSDGQNGERHFEAALAVDGIAELPFELARTKLVYGEWLRRARRRADARTHLRAALEIFERLGATPWAERARGELRASGETARKRDPSTLQQLTAQERQVACLAGHGLTNQQIAERLFVSPHTVGYHLHKLYAKLGIASRAELGQLDLDNVDPADLQNPCLRVESPPFAEPPGARPAGPAASSVLLFFDRRAPTKEAHRRAICSSDGLRSGYRSGYR
jgi:DNA-binding CsgD family transcriptional regulator